MLRKGLDLSHYEDPPYDFKKLRLNGYEWMCTKATQGTHTKDEQMVAHVTGAKDAGMFTGVFHFLEPTGNSIDQMKYFWNYLRPVDGKIDFLCLDFERAWKWVLVKEKKNKPGVWTKVNQSKENIYFDVVQAVNYLEFQFKQLPIIYYTRVSWLQEYCPALIKFFENRPMIMAKYPYDVDLSIATEDVKAKFMDNITKYKPAEFSPFNKVLLWQVSEKWKEDGMNSVTDLDIIYNQAEYDKWRKYTPPVVPPSPMTPTDDLEYTTARWKQVYKDYKERKGL